MHTGKTIMKLPIKILFTSSIFISSAAYSGEQPVDISMPFICRDISPNTITINNSRIHIDGVSYTLIAKNSHPRGNITNLIFQDTSGTTEINVMQNKKTGSLILKFIKFNTPISLIPINADIERYKEYEIGTSSWGEMKKKNLYLRGDGLGCKNK